MTAVYVSTLIAAASAATTAPLVSVTQAPLVMRLGPDEFRIAFGIDGAACYPRGCQGFIRYRVDWQTEDGLSHSELRYVHYAVHPNTRRTITVDRQYLDTAEGQHTTHVTEVRIERITCRDGPRVARL